MIIPLFTTARFKTRVRTLNAELRVAGKEVVMHTALIGAIPSAELRRPAANVADQQLDIQDALDALLGGY